MIFTRTMELLQKEILARYEVSSTIRHRGEKGRQREQGYAMFLREYLPDRYGVATGEVIPYVGDAPSPQCDVIVYDRMSFPVIGKSSAIQQVPLEAVYAVTEVKSHIDKAAIEDAQAKFDAIRALPRCRRKRPPEDGAEHLPVFVLFGYHLRTGTKECLDFVHRAPNHDTAVVALDSGIAFWAKLPAADAAPVFFGERGTEEAGSSHTLCLCLAWHLECLGNIDLGTYPPLEMFFHG